MLCTDGSFLPNSFILLRMYEFKTMYVGRNLMGSAPLVGYQHFVHVAINFLLLFLKWLFSLQTLTILKAQNERVITEP